VFLEFDGKVPFAVKASDNAFMRKCSFNEAVMMRLLESGYAHAALQETGDLSAYPRFLVRLLRMNGDGEEDAEALRFVVSFFNVAKKCSGVH